MAASRTVSHPTPIKICAARGSRAAMAARAIGGIPGSPVIPLVGIAPVFLRRRSTT